MSIRSCFLAGVALVSAPFARSQAEVLGRLPEVPGRVACDSNFADGSCRIAWDFAGAQRAYYWVQQLDPASGSWRDTDKPYTDVVSQSKRETPVETAHLYRVVGCNDAKATTDCVGSRVIWAPFVPRNEEEAKKIPELMQFALADGKVETFSVDKDQGLQLQAIQYNVYMLVRSIARVRVSDLPPMTEPRNIDAVPSESLDTVSDADWVQANVYTVYRQARGEPVTLPPEPSTPIILQDHKPVRPPSP